MPVFKYQFYEKKPMCPDKGMSKFFNLINIWNYFQKMKHSFQLKLYIFLIQN